MFALSEISQSNMTQDADNEGYGVDDLHDLHAPVDRPSVPATTDFVPASLPRPSLHLRSSELYLFKTPVDRIEAFLEDGATQQAIETLRRHAAEIDVNARDYHGRTLLNYAVRRQDELFVRAMLKLDERRSFGERLMLDDCLTVAVKEMNFDLVTMLLEFADKRFHLDDAGTNATTNGARFGRLLYFCQPTKFNPLRRKNDEVDSRSRDDSFAAGSVCRHCGRHMADAGEPPLLHGRRRVEFSRESADFEDALVANPLLQAAVLDATDTAGLESFKRLRDVIELLLRWGFDVPWPDVENVGDRTTLRDLRTSKERLRVFQALCSPSLTSLTVVDFVLHYFNLSKELEALAGFEPEFNSDYVELAVKCRQYTSSLMDQCRDKEEVERLLSQVTLENESRGGVHSSFGYPRLLLAVQLEQKEFVVHPNSLKVLDSTWSKDQRLWVSPERAASKLLLTFCVHALLLPLTCALQLLWPSDRFSSCGGGGGGGVGSFWDLSHPRTKCLRNLASYLYFLVFLLVEIVKGKSKYLAQYGTMPDVFEWLIMIYLLGSSWQLIVQVRYQGRLIFFNDPWNVFSSIMHGLFFVSYSVWGCGTILFGKYKSDFQSRFMFQSFNYVLIAEVIFCVATMMAFLRVLQVFQLHPIWGPMQLALLRTCRDILYFVFVFVIFIFCAACGVQMLYVNYADEWLIEEAPFGRLECKTQQETFTDVLKTFKTLFWHLFGYGEADDADLLVRNRLAARFTEDEKAALCDPTLGAAALEATVAALEARYNVSRSAFLERSSHQPTELAGYLIVFLYDVTAIVILLNILIAMMNVTFSEIQLNADREWKFSKVMFMLRYYHVHGVTIPPPFNLLPRLGFFVDLFDSLRRRDFRRFFSCCSCSCCDAVAPQSRGYSMSTEGNKADEDLQRRLHRRYMNARAEALADDHRKLTPELMSTMFEGILRDRRVEEKRRKLTIDSGFTDVVEKVVQSSRRIKAEGQRARAVGRGESGEDDDNPTMMLRKSLQQRLI